MVFMIASKKGTLRIMDAHTYASLQHVPTVQADPQQHSLLHSIGLHLLPGVLILLFALIIGPIVIRAGLPPLLVPSLWVLFVLIPFELGFLFYQGKKRNGKLSLRGIVLYREKMPAKSYVLLIPPLLIWGVLAFLLISAQIEPYLMKTLFSWLPNWFFTLFTIGKRGEHSSSLLLMTILLYMLTNPAAAFVEELYFRGYLLPRLAAMRGRAPLINTVLFSLQHLFSPWQNLSRILAFLPIAYVVSWKKNIYISMIIHCTLDFVSALSLLFLLSR
jgi:uncharacterized protein